MQSIHPARVHIHGQEEQLKGEAPLAGQKMTTAAAGTNTKEGRAFFQMAEAHEITTKIRGATMGTMFIFPPTAELLHLQGGWEHRQRQTHCSCLPSWLFEHAHSTLASWGHYSWSTYNTAAN